MNRESSVGRATGYGLDDQMIGVRFPAVAGNFSLRHRVYTGSEAQQPPIQGVHGAFSLGENLPGRDSNHSLQSSDEIKEFVELYLHSHIRHHGVVRS
jgi:hypothetical protein